MSWGVVPAESRGSPEECWETLDKCWRVLVEFWRESWRAVEESWGSSGESDRAQQAEDSSGAPRAAFVAPLGDSC